ncbi:MAG: cache domain-containing protein [Rhizobacter sp.]|nr:cache domain-containing protein [Rhizobacter sp.]
MFNLNSLSLTKKLGLIIGSALFGIILLATAFLVSERNLILEERKGSVRQTVEVAHGLLVHFHDQVSKGKLSDDEGKQRAMAAIKALRYSSNEYFWINDMHPKMVMHAIKAELDGKDLTDNKDPTGKRLFVEFVNTVKASGSGFVFYMWPKPGSEQPVQKVSYVKGFEPWGWVVGSGVYIDTVNATIVERVIGMSVGSLLLAIVLLAIGLVVARSLLRELGGEPEYATLITKRIADGDLSVDIALKPNDQSSLLHAIKSMRDSFTGIVGRVREGSESVATASSEIAQGNLDLSQRTEEQASALEETAASMEQLSATVKQNADNARQANQLAQSASTVAASGGAIVGQVVETMKGINDSSKRISDIIGVIDGIAFQTNILALNAAVEAARAGEQGRGFAVVAAEVRNLAGRSAGAAKEIKSLINDSVSRVEQGTALVDKAGTTMTEVVGSIKRVTDIMQEITAASAEQSQGVSQVGEAVAQMDQVTQQNASLVEESAAAAESLKLQAQQLVQVVAVFKLS